MALRAPWIVTLSSVLFAIAPSVVVAQTAREKALVEYFEKKVRPVLVNNCYNCHSANTNSRGGLRVDDRNGLILGGSKGPAVIPGDPEKSLLIQAVRQTHAEVKMPPKKQLGPEEIAALTKWIKDGATWPKVVVPVSITQPSAKYERLRKEHWAWQPLHEVKAPSVKDAAWPRADLDRFILARLEEKGLKPVQTADRLTLIRRVTFDLTGLPPTLQEIDDFLQDASAQALEKVVDRLLASPAYGEKWGRHWLDIARYGESTGSARNLPYPHAWRYRDYVIDAFNSDKPYDQFIREQIAGDLLPASSPGQRDEQLIATGFLALGVRDVNQRFKVRFTMDNIDEQIDTVSRSVLALTVSCARCHNHKFDPIPTTDYYALAGIFQSSDLCAGLRNKMGGGGMDYYDTALLLPLGSGKNGDAQVAFKIEQAKSSLAQARADLLALSEDLEKNPPGPEREKKLTDARKKVDKIQGELIALNDPAAHGPVALGVRDGKIIADTEVRIRGEAEQLGPTVPRGFLSVFEVPNTPKINPSQSGRLELAQWLTSPKNPLTPRVMANRVWQHLFGQGIVLSVDNFGVTGDDPSHPELLDHLANQLVRDGWSIKKLVRTVVLSQTYQLSADAVTTNLATDPANRYLWRHAPRRLEAEEIRDAMLAAAGKLDLGRPMGSPAQNLKVTEVRNDGAEAKRLEKEALASQHRSVYLPLVRGITPQALEVFDFAEQGMVTGSRETTTVATQALYLLNDPFVRQQAKALAERMLQRKDLDDLGRITLAYRLTVNRPPTTNEMTRAKDYLTSYESAVPKQGPNSRIVAWASFCQAILASAEFRFVK
jgi:mono/diheme cytochrome c family protein